MRASFTALALLLLAAMLHAQDASFLVRTWFQEEHFRMGLTERDATELEVTSAHTDRKGVSFVYVRQTANGLPVFGAVANCAVHRGRVVHVGDRLLRDIASRVPPAVPGIGAAEALRRAAPGLELPKLLARTLRQVSPTEFVLDGAGLSRDPIPARLIYQPLEDGSVRLAWDLTVRSVTTPNWWHVALDAHTGEVLRTTDHIVHCHHDAPAASRAYNALDDLVSPPALPPMPDGSGYRVFALPSESPAHGPHELVSAPADPQSSPQGWHDVDGLPGAEYTITRGNNVYAYEDMADNDFPGYSPDGGPGLLFDFPFAPPQAPESYIDASVTNLFYTCNMLHDILYRYGFDEASGNFQENNFGHGGWADDPVIAEAQDGGGTNNANFGTPPDGGSGRMQMYLWRTPSDSTFFVNAPSSIASVYTAAAAGFGPPLPGVPLTADVVLAEDDTPPVNNACETLVNASALAGKMALVDRGQCTFISKVEALQAAGAVAVIVVNNAPGGPISMGGSGGQNIVIPAIMISQADGQLIKDALLSGAVNATLVGTAAEDLRDSGFDNGIIAHEYGHGVSNRLTGGGDNVDCLWNNEQMGEGWSDYLGMVISMRPGDEAAMPRGVGTFVRDQPNDGPGIRPAPYTTDMSVNGYTYGNTNDPNLSQPHGVGFVWATMLWDMTWALIDQYGFADDLLSGDGGNTLAVQLVMDGLKLQPCNPGFVDGRDAILVADQLLTGGTNECLLWNVFAGRGLGFSADQGSSNNRFDQVEAFDVPIWCTTVGTGETAGGMRNALRLAPNPAAGQVAVRLSSPLKDDAVLRMIAADGRVALHTIWPAGTATREFGLRDLAPGVYAVELRMDGAVLVARLVVE